MMKLEGGSFLPSSKEGCSLILVFAFLGKRSFVCFSSFGERQGKASE